MRVGTLCLLLGVVFSLGLVPTSGLAFWSDKKIELVQEGTFDDKNNVPIEKVLEEYGLCKEGDWRSLSSQDGKKTVSYRCLYDVKALLMDTFAQQHMTDASLQNAVMEDLAEQDFALDYLLTFAVDEKASTFALSHMDFVFKGTKQAVSPQEFSAQVDKILRKKSFTLPLTGKAGQLFAYTAQKQLLSTQASYQKSQSHVGKLPESFKGEGSITLVTTLHDLVFDDAQQSIQGQLTMELVAMPAKTAENVQEEAGYFFKYFRAALGPRPQVLYTENVPVRLVPATTHVSKMHFVSANNKAQVFFEKSDATAPKDMRIEYVHGTQGHTLTPAQNAAQTQAPVQSAEQAQAKPQQSTLAGQSESPVLVETADKNAVAAPVVLSAEEREKRAKVRQIVQDVVGSYGFDAAGMEGSASIAPVKDDEQSIAVSIKTVHVQALHLCGYEGICTYKDSGFLCAMVNTPEGMDSTFPLVPMEEGFSIPVNPSFLCGARGFMHGEYSRCEENSVGPLSMTVIPVEVIHEGDAYIVRFTDDGSESLDFVSQAQAEFLETMIGKKVLVHYNKNQVWDAEKNFCKRGKEIIAVVDASLPEVQLLGGYSHISKDVRGYAFIEPNFENKALFNVHFNNYSNDLDKNCQFAGECYAEGQGFFCQSFDHAQKEFFEIIPTRHGFTVPKNSTNICEYTDFMSGKYSKCDSVTYANSSISGVLLEVDQENFADTTLIVDSYGNKILVSVTKEQVAQAQHFVGKKVFISYADKQFWSMHDRACVREKQMISINDTTLIQESLLGNYQHNAKGVQGSAIVSPATKQSLEEQTPFHIEVINKGLASQETCSFSGICTPGGKGFVCQSQANGEQEKEFLTLIPQDNGFDIALSLSSMCSMKGMRAGNYSKCTKQTLGAGTVTGTLTTVKEEENGTIYFVVQINDKEMAFTMTHGRLDLTQKLVGKKVLVHYKDEQKWHEQEKICAKMRTFTSIKEVK